MKIKKGFVVNLAEKVLCLPLIPVLLLLTFLYKGPSNKKRILFKDGESLDLEYRSFFSYLLQGIYHFFLNRVELIGAEGDGTTIERPGIITRFLMQELTLFPGRNLHDANSNYISNRSFISDWRYLLKFLFLGLFIRTYEFEDDNYELLKVRFSNYTYDTTLKKLREFSTSKKRNVVSFINAHCLNLAHENKEYASILKKSDLVLPDGMGVQMGCRIMGYHLRDNVNGTDLFPRLINLLIKENLSVYLLGGTSEVNEGLINFLKTSYPSLKISGGHHGHFDHDTANEKIIEEINLVKSDVLLVAFGVPAQEVWINKNYQKINSNVIMGVGGLFDFYSGKNKRAPQWIRELGLEWIYRIYQEPKRMWKRYLLGNPKFLLRVLLSRK